MRSLRHQSSAQGQSTVELSVVVPVFNGGRTIAGVVERIHAALASRSIEVILVNDGSADDSQQVGEGLVQRYPHTVTLVQLSRNFGEHNAVLAGLTYTSGQYVAVIDDDGQNAPEDLPAILDHARQFARDVVYTRYAGRQHPWHRVWGSWLHDRVANIVLNKPRGLYLSSFKLMSRFVVDRIAPYAGPFPYLDGLILRITRNIGQVDVQHHPRQGGRSGYTLRKLVGLWMHMCVGSSLVPLRVALATGLIASVLGLVMLAVLVIARIGSGLPLGTAALIAAMVLAAGTQLIFLGVVGEYVGRVFLQQSGHPAYVVRHVRAGAADTVELAEPTLATKAG